MKRIYVLIIVATAITFSVANGQTVAVKTNLLYDATATVNLGLEVGVSSRWTLDLPVNYNPWDFGENRKIKHWMIQPEARYWLCQKFNGRFIGFHGHVGGFNIGGMKLIGIEDFRYEGTFYGGGVSYGYQWILNTHWSIEATIGLGYALIDYSKYNCEKCASKLGSDTHHYLGPTKAGVSLIYLIK
jgi:opacity protein-like surface antigen